MEKTQMIRLGDCEPSCPKCGNANAMLGWPTMTCRDCGYKVEAKDAEITHYETYEKAMVAKYNKMKGE